MLPALTLMRIYGLPK